MKNNIRKFTKTEVLDLIYEDGAVELEKGEWRWGVVHTWVIPFEGKFWRFRIKSHVEEGYEDDDVDAIEVEKKEIMVLTTQWISINIE